MKEFRRLHSERMCKLQEEADAGRIGGMIKNIMGGSQPFTMESIRHEGKVITDGDSVDKLITSFFAKWFSRLPEQKIIDSRLSACVINHD